MCQSAVILSAVSRRSGHDGKTLRKFRLHVCRKISFIIIDFILKICLLLTVYSASSQDVNGYTQVSEGSDAAGIR